MRRRDFLSRAGAGVGAGALLGGCLGRSVSSSPTRTKRTGTTEPTRTATPTPRPVGLEADFREARRDVGTSVVDFEAGDAWSCVRGTVDRVVDSARDGTVLRLETGENVEEALVTREFGTARDLSGRAFSIAAKWEAPTDGWYHVTLALRDESGDCVRYTQTVEAQHLNDWNRLDLGMHSEEGDPDLSAVTSLDLMTWVGGNPSRVSLGELRSTPTADVGYVMFTFDDVPESTYTAAYPAMQEHGLAGCGGAIKEWIGGPGTMSMRQLDELAAAGWEFCSHPQYDELPIPEMDHDRLRRTLVEYKRWLLDHGFDRGAETIIYPYGVVDDAALEVVADYHELGFKLQRGQYGPSITSPLLVGRTDGDRPRLVRQAVDRAAKYGLAVPLMYHKIGAENRISKAGFEATVEYVANTDGVQVVTPGEYLTKLKNGTL